jgi:hypothetical protein
MVPYLRTTSLALVTASVVLVGIAGIQLSLLAPSSGGIGSTSPGVVCNHPLGNPESANHATVYRITSPSALLCLNYTKGSLGKSTFHFSPQSWVQNGQDPNALRPCQIVQGEYQCPDFTIIASPASAVFENSKETIALAYTITASPSASGLYIFFLTPGNPIYLSFGEPPKTVFHTCWTIGTRLQAGVLLPSYNIVGGTNVVAAVVPWA